MSQEQEPSRAHSMMQYVLDNKLKTILSCWAGGITLSMAYEWSRPIPSQLKVIHSRVYAQALTLAALGAVAAVEMYAEKEHPEAVKPADKHGY
ncbi:hypoxia induced conserved region containing [Micractinium conductrix]|uniref:Hypoxia induced conserved region containing n=1 Tax=Micractinium conductrix TaxID=554055 RepID=A0A2P6V238_9CHLO|nr:hypoxia induced conserved region containing [Micractinium conductrix]|eukprot:PSC68152.1 hypoxia induced conserved region containing [Micractinium conductrix]